MKAAAQIQTLVDALVATGWRLWTTSHNNTPAAQRVFQWMRDAAPGHFVLEVTTLAADRAMDRVGVLLSVTRTLSGLARSTPGSHEWTIRTIDGRELRWENASFVRIPRSEADNREIFLLGDQST